jgi:hypothetical protein
MKKINISKFLEKFNQEYNFLYCNNNVAGADEAVEEYDKCIKNENFQNFVCEFVKYRNDIISSDREAAAFMFALASFE